MRRIAEKPLRVFVVDILRRGGLNEHDAELVTDVLMFAELRGVSSHGVGRLPFYLERLRSGGTDPLARPTTVTEGPAVGLIDANNGMGHVACMTAVDMARRKAEAVGVAYVGVRGSAHNGALSYYAIKLAEADLAGFVFTNTTPLMTAWGGATKALGTNPMAFAAPYQPNRPFVFDAAMSSVAAGRIRDASARGETIPRGWILDQDGRDTEDPGAFDQGALLPFGGHKGYGLAVIVEILAAVLTGAGMLHQNPFWQEAVDHPLNIGHAVLAIDVGRFMDVSEFTARLTWMASALKESPPAHGSEGVLIPGEIELAETERRMVSGIPVPDAIWRQFEVLAAQYDVPLPVAEERE